MVFIVFGLSLTLSLVLFMVSSPNTMTPDPWNDIPSILIFSFAILILVFGCLPLFKMRTLRIGPHHIAFQKYLLDSYIKEVSIKNYDYYKIVQEESENGIFEAVWLIKNGKLADSFSTYQYSNYKDLKAALNLRYEGVLDLSPMKQLLCKLGASI